MFLIRLNDPDHYDTIHPSLCAPAVTPESNLRTYYFPGQRTTLCDWHELDPVAQQEWDRNQRIAGYQSGQPNPYILDCTLAFRAFCPERPLPACGFTKTENSRLPSWLSIPSFFPNPFADAIQLNYELYRSATVRVQLFDAQGRLLYRQTSGRQTSGEYRQRVSTEALPAGIYCLRLEVRSGRELWTQTEKLIKH